MTCPDCKGPHPTEASDWSDFLHMLRSHRDPFFDDTIDALIAKIEALVAVLPEGVTVEQMVALWERVWDPTLDSDPQYPSSGKLAIVGQLRGVR